MQVYQIVRKLTDDRASHGDNGRLSGKVVYDQIQVSNSSIKRKSKKQLEDSIERVLDVIRDEAIGEDGADSVDGDFEGLEDSTTAVAAVRLATLSLQCLF